MTPSPRPNDRRVQSVCLLILTLIAAGVAMALLQPVLVPFVLALFLSQCLAPLIQFLMRRLRLPQLAAVTVAVVLAVAALTGVGFVVSASVNNGSVEGKFTTYQDSLNRLARWAMSSRAAHLVGVHEPTLPPPAVSPEAAAAAAVAGQPGPSATQPSAAGNGFAFNVGDAVPFIGNTIGQVVGLVKSSASVLLLMTFILYGRSWDRDLPTPDGRSRITAEVEARVQQYISVTVAISLLTGLLVGAALAALNVQFAAVWGLLAFLLTFIPNFGGVIATLLPLPVVMLDPHLSVVSKGLAIAIPSAIQMLVGSFIQPKMTGQSLDLHPVVILLSLLFFTMIWNVAGAFLAVPLTVTFKIVFEKIPYLSPLAAALAGNLDPLTHSLDVHVAGPAAVPVLTPEGGGGDHNGVGRPPGDVRAGVQQDH